MPGLRGFRQTAAFLAGSAWIVALALGMAVAFARVVPGANEAVGRVIRWLWDAAH